jgi:hypothetical protein
LLDHRFDEKPHSVRKRLAGKLGDIDTKPGEATDGSSLVVRS